MQLAFLALTGWALWTDHLLFALVFLWIALGSDE
jgi:hypothetical protein